MRINQEVTEDGKKIKMNLPQKWTWDKIILLGLVKAQEAEESNNKKQKKKI